MHCSRSALRALATVRPITAQGALTRDDPR